MMTGLAQEKDLKRGRLLGANDYIVKPLEELGFLERIAHALGKPRTTG
jgi:DNA-binding response OmpR family regulator